MPTKYKKSYLDYTEQELLAMTREEACAELDGRQRLFCEFYAAKHNAVMAARKAGYSAHSVHSVTYRLLQRENIKLYVGWLRAGVSRELHISAIDLVDHYVRIAFADITDFVSIKNGRMYLEDTENIDGQLVKSVKHGRDGVQVELYDKLAALAKLERYLDIMPADWKQKLEERKVKIMEEKLELDKQRAGQYDESVSDDGFLDALRSTAEEVWDE